MKPVRVCMMLSVTGGTPGLLRVVSVLHRRSVEVQELTCTRDAGASASRVRMLLQLPEQRVEHVRACLDRVVDVTDLRVVEPL